MSSARGLALVALLVTALCAMSFVLLRIRPRDANQHLQAQVTGELETVHADTAMPLASNAARCQAQGFAGETLCVVRVRCADDAAPIAHAFVVAAEVEFIADELGSAAITGEAGTLLFAQWASGGLRVHTSAQGYLPRSANVDSNAAVLELELFRAAEIGGFVVEALTGQPIDGAHVSFRQDWDDESHIDHARSSDTGAFEIALVRPGIAVELEVEAGGYARTFATMHFDKSSQIVLKLGGAGSVRGRVHDPGGTAAADVQVFVFGELSRNAFIARSNTDAHGEFEVSGLALPSAYYVTASKHHGWTQPQARDIWLRARSAPFELSTTRFSTYVELELAGPDTTLVIDVVDEVGLPLRGATVAVYARNLHDLPQIGVARDWSSAMEITDAAGHCQFERVCGSDFEVLVGLTGWVAAPLFANVASKDRTAVVVRMRREETLTAVVLDPVDVQSCIRGSADFADLADVRTVDLPVRLPSKVQIRVRDATHKLVGAPTVCAVRYRDGQPLYTGACTSSPVGDGAFELELEPGRYKLYLCPFGSDELLEGAEIDLADTDVAVGWDL